MTSRPASANGPAARSGPRGNRRRAGAALVALLAVLGGAVASTAAVAQEGSASTAVRIVARKLDSGRVEFGLQQRQPARTWGDRQLPRVRFFPTTATVGRWLASSTALDLPAGEVRIVARKLDSGRIEFGLQQRQPARTWGDRQLPRVRFFPTTATVGRWLASSTLDLPAGEVRIAAQPGGRYTAVSAGSLHTCGLRTDGTITCWGGNVDGGDNYWGQAIAPDGRYTAVSAGGLHSCGLRTDGTITCWGWDKEGQTTVPDGQYSAVSAAAETCGLRTDGTITCWGNNGVAGELHTVPDGRYTAVDSNGNGHACGLRTDGTITCWGGTWGEGSFNLRQLTVPDVRYTAVDVGFNYSCGLRTDGTITCSGYRRPRDAAVWRLAAPDGQYAAFSAGGGHACALRTDGTITCWGDKTNGAASAPDGQYSAVSAGLAHSCGLRTDGTITCWGWNEHGQATAPDR